MTANEPNPADPVPATDEPLSDGEIETLRTRWPGFTVLNKLPRLIATIDHLTATLARSEKGREEAERERDAAIAACEAEPPRWEDDRLVIEQGWNTPDRCGKCGEENPTLSRYRSALEEISPKGFFRDADDLSDMECRAAVNRHFTTATTALNTLADQPTSTVTDPEE